MHYDFLGLWGVVVVLFKCYSLLRDTLCKLMDSKAFLRLHLPFVRAGKFYTGFKLTVVLGSTLSARSEILGMP